MIRVLGEPLVFFTIPFVLYIAYLLLRLLNPFVIERWSRSIVLRLTALGLLCAVGSLVVFGLFANRYEGGYRPAHIENGHIVPGSTQ